MTTTDQASAPARQPVLYLSHGAPPLADDTTWTAELAQWSLGPPPAELGPDGVRALGARPDRGLGDLG